MSLNSLNDVVGSSVVFTNTGGYEDQQSEALELLTLGDTYVIADIDIGNWYSTVLLEGHPGKRFNTCLFEDV